MIKAKPVMNLELIKDYLNYDPESGIFTWKKNLKGPAKEGMIAGARHSRGYITIGFNGESYLAHRLAWAFTYNEISQNMQIDHINGDRGDNKISNLRLASHEENCRNSKPRKHNKSGIKGVRKENSKWAARIRVNKKEIWLGTFETSDEAAKAYQDAAKKYFGQFAK
jgi:hypothetical protein